MYNFVQHFIFKEPMCSYGIQTLLSIFVEDFLKKEKKKLHYLLFVKTKSDLNLNIAVCVTLEPV